MHSLKDAKATVTEEQDASLDAMYESLKDTVRLERNEIREREADILRKIEHLNMRLKEIEMKYLRLERKTRNADKTQNT